MAKPFFRQRVPDGSTFSIVVSGDGDADAQTFVATGHFETPDGQQGEWNDAELRLGQKRTLKSPGVYTGRLDVLFSAPASARVQMEVAKADDAGRHVYDETLSGTAGQLERINLLLVMKRS